MSDQITARQKMTAKAEKFPQSDRTPQKELETGQKYALLSVSDKTGLADFARTLDSLGYRIISTGGTAKTLAENGVGVIPIQEITGNPESFDGRMKTISFQIESGIIYDRTNPSHQEQAQALGIKPIDLVVCNLYPFEKTIEKPGVAFDEVIENIDVGGPTMVRAAAKNHKNVLVVVDPNDYETVLNALQNGEVSDNLRRSLAEKAFWHLSFYDSQIARYLKGDREGFPKEFTLPGRLTEQLRYGDNPHQEAAVYETPGQELMITNLEKIVGRELSLTNLTDINAGYEAVRLFSEPCAVVIKHNSPCGIALGDNIAQALKRAIESDPESAFGGVVVLNKQMGLDAAEIIASFKKEEKSMMDIIAAPQITPEVIELLQKVRKTTGVYAFDKITKPQVNDVYIKGVDGGFILQTADAEMEESLDSWEVVTDIKPTQQQIEQMRVAWKFISRIKSNTVVVLDKDLSMTRGIGSGQTSRFRSTAIALEQAGENAIGAILASDSFFPFDDCVKLAAKHGIKTIVQQGGSRNDQASIDAANKAGITMVFTNRRAFWH